MSSGRDLERLVRRSAEGQGIRITQTGPRAIGTGKTDLRGRPISVHVESGQLDFVCTVQGRHVEFDAKACANLTSFPLREIRHNQAVICRHRHEEGCVAGFLVEFTRLEPAEYYWLPWPVLAPIWRKAPYGGPQSIPLATFRALCPHVRTLPGGRLDLSGILGRLLSVGAGR